MAYDELLAERMRGELTAMRTKFVEKKMFGGVAFMVKDRMCCGITKDDLMVRVPDARYEGALKMPHAREMDFTGKPLRGFVYVGEEGTKNIRSLQKWLKMGVEFAMTAKPKSRKKAKPMNMR